MLRSAIQAEAPQVDAVRAAMQRWNSIESAIDPRRYPIEILYQAVRLLPEDGVRLTLFQMDLDRVVVAGEASTLQAAQRFQEELRKNPDLADYDWTTENPRPLPTGSAAFQIDGVRHGASAGDMEDADAGADS
jgi:Tfp pilus assembly protein PilN